jgi:hypothetical protein
MIPKRIHFIWFGPPMPAWAERNIEEFRRLNPAMKSASTARTPFSLLYAAPTPSSPMRPTSATCCATAS